MDNQENEQLDLSGDFEDGIQDIKESISALRARIKAKRAAARTFRRRAIPALQSSLSSTADIAGTMLFLLGVRGSEDESVRSFENPLFGLAVLASSSGLVTVGSHLAKHVPSLAKAGGLSKYVGLESDGINGTSTNRSGGIIADGSDNDDFEGFDMLDRYRKITSAIQYGMGSEVLLHDIPQILLTGLVYRSKSVDTDLDAIAIFNIASSGLNMIFNALDMSMPYEEEEYHSLERAQAQDHVRNRTPDNERTCRIFSAVLVRVGIIVIIIIVYMLVR